MRKISLLLTILMVTVLTLTSCAECINTEHKNVSVDITDVYHRSAYSTPMRVGNTTIM